MELCSWVIKKGSGNFEGMERQRGWCKDRGEMIEMTLRLSHSPMTQCLSWKKFTHHFQFSMQTQTIPICQEDRMSFLDTLGEKFTQKS